MCLSPSRFYEFAYLAQNVALGRIDLANINQAEMTENFRVFIGTWNMGMKVTCVSCVVSGAHSHAIVVKGWDEKSDSDCCLCVGFCTGERAVDDCFSSVHADLECSNS